MTKGRGSTQQAQSKGSTAAKQVCITSGDGIKMACSPVPVPPSDASSSEDRDAVCIGVTHTEGQDQPFRIPVALRDMTTHIVGSCGMGKSILMMNMKCSGAKLTVGSEDSMANLFHQLISNSGILVVDCSGLCAEDQAILESSILLSLMVVAFDRRMTSHENAMRSSVFIDEAAHSGVARRHHQRDRTSDKVPLTFSNGRMHRRTRTT